MMEEPTYIRVKSMRSRPVEVKHTLGEMYEQVKEVDQGYVPEPPFEEGNSFLQVISSQGYLARALLQQTGGVRKGIVVREVVNILYSLMLVLSRLDTPGSDLETAWQRKISEAQQYKKPENNQ